MNQKAIRAGALALIAGLGAFWCDGAAAWAQQALSSEPIIVTAQLRDQSILDVPMAVSALDSAALDHAGITTFEDLARFTPGLNVQEQSANNAGFVIRGITSDSGQATAEPRIAIFQDGVPASRSRGSYVELFDLERVEVARGPQATLYGHGALIGAISVIQNKVDLNAFSLNAQIAGGDFGYYRSLLVMNAPLLEDHFGLRIAATARGHDGYTANALGGEDLGGAEMTALRVSAAWAPNASTRFDLIGNLQEDDTTGTAFISRRHDACAPTGPLTQSCTRADPYGQAALSTFGGFEDGRPLGLDRGVYSATLLGQIDIAPHLSLHTASGYRYFRALEVVDPDGYGLPLMVASEDAKGSQWSQDVRLNYEGAGSVSWFVGASYLNERGRQRVPFMFDERVMLAHLTGNIGATPQTYAALTDPAVLQSILQTSFGAPAAYAPALAAALQPNYEEVYVNRGQTEALDLYGDATWALSDRFELSAGVRWARQVKTSTYEAHLEDTGSILGTLFVLPALTPSQRDDVLNAIQANGATPLASGLFTQPTLGASSASDSFDGFTWRLVGRYALADNASLWASYARGRRPEVIAPSGPRSSLGAPSFATVAAETVDSFEIGGRVQLQRGLSLEGSAYHYSYDNFQTLAFDGAALITVNAGAASATGFEGQADWRLAPWVDVFGAYTYNHARFETGARQGNSFRLSPDHALTVGASFDFALGDGVLSIIPSYRWQSKIYFDDENDNPALQIRRPGTLSDTARDELQGAYGLLNVRATYQGANNSWGIEAFVDNVTDERYLLDAGNTGDLLGIPTFIRGAPRTYGLQLSKRF